MNAELSYRPAGSLPAEPLAPYAGPWNVRLAAHLLRRAGFGGSPNDVAKLARLSPADAVESLIRFPATDALPSAPDLVDDEAGPAMQPGAAMQPGGFGAFGGPQPASKPDPNDPAVQARMTQVRALRRQQDLANVTWWLNRMQLTPAPLQEKMTLFLHGRFATAANAKGIYGLDIVDQNNLLRRYALGNFRSLVHEISRDRAMLKWLDNARNLKAHPNENYARELMELFTLGIGNYSEQDVRESARAFTGWTFRRRDGQFFFNARQHDDGSKTFLGRTGNFNGDDVIDIIFAQQAAAKFLASKVLGFFVYSDPEPALVDALASVVRKYDFELAPVMSTLLRSQVFFSERAYRALVKSPVEFVVGTSQLFGVRELKPEVIGVLGRMGQIPFHPPSVKGWDGGAQWLNTQTVLARENFVSSLMASPDMAQYHSWLSDGPPGSSAEATRKLVDAILQGDASPSATLRLKAYLDGGDAAANQPFSGENFEQRMRGAAYLTMAMPAYQLS